MIHKYYYLFTRPSVIAVCWKSIFFQVSSIFSGANNLDHFWMRGIGGRNFMLDRGENLLMKYPWGEQVVVENVCPLGAEKGQSLPNSALRVGGKLGAELACFCIQGFNQLFELISTLSHRKFSHWNCSCVYCLLKKDGEEFTISEHLTTIVYEKS